MFFNADNARELSEIPKAREEELATIFRPSDAESVKELIVKMRLSEAEKIVEEPNPGSEYRLVVSHFGSLAENIRIAQNNPIDVIT